jgi:transglutaminase-like putative cysteine protease
MMLINVGFVIYDCPQPTPMIFNLNVHFTRVSDLVGRDDLVFDPPVPMTAYRDGFGNWCTRIVAPEGRTRVTANALVNGTGLSDIIVPEAQQIPVQDLPVDTLVYLLGSRYCETDRLSETAWKLFEHGPTGWGRSPGNLRLRSQPYPVRLRARASDTDGTGDLQQRDRCLP